MFDADAGATVETEDRVESVEGHLNLSGDSAISSTSVVSSTCDHPADIVSLSVWFHALSLVFAQHI